jgi:hypothetical protein
MRTVSPTLESTISQTKKISLCLTDDDTILPAYVISGIKTGINQAKNGQTKSLNEVKEILANRWV